jgi:hypothetical protein
MPMIFKFCLLMESESSCIFLSQILSILSKESSLFFLIFILSLSPEILSSTCSSLLEWLSTVFFCLTQETFYLHDFCLILLRCSISLLNSPFISCAIFFSSFIFCIISLVSLWSSLKSFLD